MRKIKIVAAAIAGAAVLAVNAIEPSAYSVDISKWSSVPVPFYINPTNADVSESAATTALQEGMDVWNTQSGTPFRFSYAGRVNDTATVNDRRNVIMFRPVDNGSVIATAYAWTSGGVRVDSDIIFWDAGWQFFTGSTGCSSGAYIEDIAAHELGHSLGLKHSTVTGSTMYASYSRCATNQRTLSADDIAGAQYLYGTEAGTSNSAPTVSISSPSTGSSVSSGQTVTFSGAASDQEDGSLTSSMKWTSNLDGQIGSGGSFSRTLTAGSHTITASATDSNGVSASKQISITVQAAANSAPTVTVSSPSNGTSFSYGQTITFSGSATDLEDGTLTSSLKWTSSIDGQIGTGGSFARTLSSGSHTITASVTDKNGASVSKAIALSVAAPLSQSGPTLTASGYKVKGQQKADLQWSGLSTSLVDVYRGSTKVFSTSNDGSVTDPIDQKGGGSYTYKVCNTGTSTCTNTATVQF